MKVIELLNLAHIIKPSKFTGMDIEASMKMLSNLDKLKTIDIEYNRKITEAREKFKPVGLDEMLEKLVKHNNAEKNGMVEDILPLSELKFIIEKHNEYSKKVDAISESLCKEEKKISFEKISESDFEDYVKANTIKDAPYQIEAGAFLFVKFVFCKEKTKREKK